MHIEPRYFAHVLAVLINLAGESSALAAAASFRLLALKSAYPERCGHSCDEKLQHLYFFLYCLGIFCASARHTPYPVLVIRSSRATL